MMLHGGTMPDQIIEVDVPTHLAACTFIPDAAYQHVFFYWKDDNGNHYANGEIVTNLAPAGGEITLWAKMAPGYNVHYDAKTPSPSAALPQAPPPRTASISSAPTAPQPSHLVTRASSSSELPTPSTIPTAPTTTTARPTTPGLYIYNGRKVVVKYPPIPRF